MSSQHFGRRSGSMRYKPKGGLGVPSQKPSRDAIDARQAAVGAKPADERIFDSRRHETEIRRSENKAHGLPEDSTETAEKPVKPGEKDRNYREPDLTVPAEVSDDHPVEVPKPPAKGILGKAKAAVEKVVKKVRQLIRPEPKIVKEVVINAEPLETRVAILEDSTLEEFTVERTNDERLVGSIYKGKVRNLEDGLKAAFVDIGFEKNAFLHYWDIIPSAFDSSVEIVERPDDKRRRRDKPKITQKDVPKLYPPGSEIIIQVTKGPISTKGPRVTTNLSLPGRYLVLLPNSDQSGISRKIENHEERQRLKKIVRELTIPEGMGVIIRTAGEGKRKAYFVRDLALLLTEWREIQERIQKQPLATCVFQEPDLIDRTVRDFLTEDVNRIIVDDFKKYEHIRESIGKISPRSAKKVFFYNEAQPLFDRFNITRQLENAFSRQVSLPSGGYLMIDETEALVAIDVNTGRHKLAGTRDHDSTILKVNSEAADEICRQLRLRNMGGIIVLDFIDMKSRKDQQTVYQRMKEGLKRDKARTHVLPLSQLGLMEMTRQRQTESVRSTLFDDCPHCKGRGVVKSAESMSVEIQRKLTQIMKSRPRDESDFQLRVACNPSVLDRLRSTDEQLLIELEKKFFVKLGFRPEPDYHHEQYRIQNALTNEELAKSGF